MSLTSLLHESQESSHYREWSVHAWSKEKLLKWNLRKIETRKLKLDLLCVDMLFSTSEIRIIHAHYRNLNGVLVPCKKSRHENANFPTADSKNIFYTLKKWKLKTEASKSNFAAPWLTGNGREPTNPAPVKNGSHPGKPLSFPPSHRSHVLTPCRKQVHRKFRRRSEPRQKMPNRRCRRRNPPSLPCNALNQKRQSKLGNPLKLMWIIRPILRGKNRGSRGRRRTCWRTTKSASCFPTSRHPALRWLHPRLWWTAEKEAMHRRKCSSIPKRKMSRKFRHRKGDFPRQNQVQISP